MKQEIPVAKSINYLALVLQSIFLILLYFIFVESGSDEPLLWSAMIYLVLAYSLRYFVPVDHRKGIRELKEGHYEAALDSFTKSFVFFSKHKWVDTFRAFTIFSASKQSYREMAMLNKAFTLNCLDKNEEAKKCYEDCLKEYPDNLMAYEALKMM
jgi:hypothetical protein